MILSDTERQMPRSARADAEIGEKLYLIKNVSRLRLTYQIRLLTYAAQTRKMKLIIRLPRAASVDASLERFLVRFSSLIQIERT